MTTFHGSIYGQKTLKIPDFGKNPLFFIQIGGLHISVPIQKYLDSHQNARALQALHNE